jgi:retron-type reverse transcriptase
MGTLGWCIIDRLRQRAISECHRILQRPNRRKQVFTAPMVNPIQLQFRRANATKTSHDEKFVLRTVSPNDFKNLVMEQFLDGKCYNLIDKVVATPEVLLTAYEKLSLNSNTKLDDVIARATSDGIGSLWLTDTSRQLREGKFDVESCCFEMVPLRVKGESLVVSNLKLKVVMEAVRMALEAVYEPRFVTFAYGGRIGMGRHTALRYIKANIVNPTWWFTVAFHNYRFDSERVQKLISIMQNKIEDTLLMNLIYGFFRANVLAIEFGSFSLGRGFPQETNLCSILINIYFHGFDKEVQLMRRIIDQANPVTRYRKKQDDHDSSYTPREHVLVDVSMTEASSSLQLWVHDQLLQRTPEGLPVIFHNPIKVYACRYLDEILVASSGSKELTMDLRNRVVEFLEGELKLKVNQSKTALHSAVSERIEFLGMEVQAVILSKLRPPMSDKAIRAWKKLIIRRQARALEKRNFRETRLKKAGMKILGHVLKKFKGSGLRNPDVPIAPQIRNNFRVWAREVINGFLQSSEEHQFWHRQFSSSEFLSNNAIREQLPRELVNAYDDFQEKVDQYFSPDKANKTEDTERQIIAEQKKYAHESVKDLTKLCIKIDAPMELVRKALRLAKLINSMGRPQPVKLLIPLEDEEIIRWYSGLATRWLDYFCCCNNFKMVKAVVNYHLRFSCILTLAEKHESTKRDAIRHYTKDLKLTDLDGGAETFFPLENKIKMMGDQHLADPKPVDGLLCMVLVRRPFDGLSTRCSALCCNKIDTVSYRIRLLQSRRNINPLDKKKWVLGLGTIHEAFDKKCLPLCAEHMKHLYSGQITLQDIDFTFLHMN